MQPNRTQNKVGEMIKSIINIYIKKISEDNYSLSKMYFQIMRHSITFFPWHT
jgi:hypothetical protein